MHRLQGACGGNPRCLVSRSASRHWSLAAILVFVFAVLALPAGGAFGSSNVTSALDQSTLTRASASKTISYGASYELTGTLSVDSSPVAGQQVRLETSSNGKTFSATSIVATTSAGGAFSFTVKPTSKLWCRARFAGTDLDTGSVCSAAVVSVWAWVGTPHAPKSVRFKRFFTVWGYLKPRRAAGTSPVRVYGYYYHAGTWTRVGSVKFKATNHSTYTKYSRRVSLTGNIHKWRLRAYFPGDKRNVASWSSGYASVSVH